jgi:hypothetical protein
MAVEPELNFIRHAQLTYAGDFLFASIRDRNCRMQYFFELRAKHYLGIPVTPKRCYISKCHGTREIHPYCAHWFHAPGIVKARHDGLRDQFVRGIQEPQRTSAVHIDVVVEPVLQNYNVARRTDAPDPSSARADIGLFLPARNWSYFLDVTVTSPLPDSDNPAGCLLVAEQNKYDRYLQNYEINKAQLIPLVFANTGGWSEQTVKFTQTIFREIANGDEVRFNKLFNRFRYRVAIILAVGDGRLINWLTWKNAFPHNQTLTNTTSGRPMETSLSSGTHEVYEEADNSGDHEVDGESSTSVAEVPCALVAQSNPDIEAMSRAFLGAAFPEGDSDSESSLTGESISGHEDPNPDSGPELDGGSPPDTRSPTPQVGSSVRVVSSYNLRPRCRSEKTTAGYV